MGPLVVVADLAALIDPASGHSLTYCGTVLSDIERRVLGLTVAMEIVKMRSR